MDKKAASRPATALFQRKARQEPVKQDLSATEESDDSIQSAATRHVSFREDTTVVEQTPMDPKISRQAKQFVDRIFQAVQGITGEADFQLVPKDDMIRAAELFYSQSRTTLSLCYHCTASEFIGVTVDPLASLRSLGLHSVSFGKVRRSSKLQGVPASRKHLPVVMLIGTGEQIQKDTNSLHMMEEQEALIPVLTFPYRNAGSNKLYRALEAIKGVCERINEQQSPAPTPKPVVKSTPHVYEFDFDETGDMADELEWARRALYEMYMESIDEPLSDSS